MWNTSGRKTSLLSSRKKQDYFWHTNLVWRRCHEIKGSVDANNREVAPCKALLKVLAVQDLLWWTGNNRHNFGWKVRQMSNWNKNVVCQSRTQKAICWMMCLSVKTTNGPWLPCFIFPLTSPQNIMRRTALNTQNRVWTRNEKRRKSVMTLCFIDQTQQKSIKQKAPPLPRLPLRVYFWSFVPRSRVLACVERVDGVRGRKSWRFHGEREGCLFIKNIEERVQLIQWQWEPLIPANTAHNTHTTTPYGQRAAGDQPVRQGGDGGCPIPRRPEFINAFVKVFNFGLFLLGGGGVN